MSRRTGEVVAGNFLTKALRKQKDYKTIGEWKKEREKEKPKFKKTETLEEFKARGGQVKALEPVKVEQSPDSRYSFNDRKAGYNSNNNLFLKKTGSAASKHTAVKKELEKRLKRSKDAKKT